MKIVYAVAAIMCAVGFFGCADPENSPPEKVKVAVAATYLLLEKDGHQVGFRKIEENIIPKPVHLRREGGFEVVADSLGKKYRQRIRDEFNVLRASRGLPSFSKGEFHDLLTQGRLTCHKAFVAEDGTVAAGRAECRNALVLSLSDGGIHSSSPATWSVAPADPSEMDIAESNPPCSTFLTATWENVQPLLRAATTITHENDRRYMVKMCEGNIIQVLGAEVARTPLAQASVAALVRYRAHGGREFMDQFRLDPEFPKQFLNAPGVPERLAPHFEAECVRLVRQATR